jgi:hypothetical protein
VGSVSNLMLHARRFRVVFASRLVSNLIYLSLNTTGTGAQLSWVCSQSCPTSAKGVYDEREGHEESRTTKTRSQLSRMKTL